MLIKQTLGIFYMAWVNSASILEREGCEPSFLSVASFIARSHFALQRMWLLATCFFITMRDQEVQLLAIEQPSRSDAMLH